MGSVARAVVEFDESVLAPWRPPLRAASTGRRAPLRAVPDPLPRRPVCPRPVLAGPAPVEGAAPLRRPRRPVGPVPVPAVRLTRRARRLGAVLGLAVGVALGSWVGSALSGDGEALRLVGESSVLVRQGDSLWSIAATVAGDEDVREVVEEIRDLNGLDDASLVPGQVLELP